MLSRDTPSAGSPWHSRCWTQQPLGTAEFAKIYPSQDVFSSTSPVDELRVTNKSQVLGDSQLVPRESQESLVSGGTREAWVRQFCACSGTVPYHWGQPGIPGTPPALCPAPRRRNTSTEELQVLLTPFYAIAAGPGKTSRRGHYQARRRWRRRRKAAMNFTPAPSCPRPRETQACPGSSCTHCPPCGTRWSPGLAPTATQLPARKTPWDEGCEN